MLRGRHRGLPDAIDRSVLLPNEMKRQSEMEEEFRGRQRVMREAIEQAKGGLRTSTNASVNVVHRDEEEDVPPGLA